MTKKKEWLSAFFRNHELVKKPMIFGPKNGVFLGGQKCPVFDTKRGLNFVKNRNFRVFGGPKIGSLDRGPKNAFLHFLEKFSP